MKSKKILIGLLLVSLSFACSKSDDDNKTATEFAYGQDQYNSIFYSTGNSAPPTINWHGSQGQFSLESPIEGVSVNSITGVVSWDKTLPLGSHEITVLASNRPGTTSTTILVENMFRGNFQGTYSPPKIIQGSKDFLVEFNFNNNGVLTGAKQFTDHEGVVRGPDLLEGSWSLEGNEINGQYSDGGVDDNDDPKTSFISGTLVVSQTEASINGLFGSNLDNLIIPFNVILVVEQ